MLSEIPIQESPDMGETIGYILSPPTLPCLVFFALEQNSPRSFFVVESKYTHSLAIQDFFSLFMYANITQWMDSL